MFTLKPLPYAYDALEPVLDEETMHVHHDKHHQAYTNKLNAACGGMDVSYDEAGITSLLASIDESAPAALKNNLGGFVNHNMYWENLAPGGSAPSESFINLINETFGSMDELKQELITLGMSQFGSGWAWLAVDEDEKLVTLKTSNQDHPMMPAVAAKLGGSFTPILTIDVWEHAYYLQYKSSRKDYLDKIVEIINWEEVERRFTATQA